MFNYFSYNAFRSGEPNLFEIIATLAICGFGIWLTWPLWAMLLAWLWGLVCSAGWFLVVVGIFMVVGLFKK